MLTQPMRMIPLGFVDKFAPAKLCIEPDQVQVKLSCKGLDYLRLHTTLNDVVMSFMMAMMMIIDDDDVDDDDDDDDDDNDGVD